MMMMMTTSCYMSLKVLYRRPGYLAQRPSKLRCRWWRNSLVTSVHPKSIQMCAKSYNITRNENKSTWGSVYMVTVSNQHSFITWKPYRKWYGFKVFTRNHFYSFCWQIKQEGVGVKLQVKVFTYWVLKARVKSGILNQQQTISRHTSKLTDKQDKLKR